MIPSLAAAIDDRRLNFHHRVAFGWLVLRGILDVGSYRPLKAVTLQVGIGCRKRTAHETLETLVRAGYLACGEHDPCAPPEARQARPRWYRLVYSPPLMVPRRTTVDRAA